MVDTMTKLRNIIGAKEFEDRVKTKLKQVDENINENDLYFYKTVTGYYMIYKPKYPERSNGDFIVAVALSNAAEAGTWVKVQIIKGGYKSAAQVGNKTEGGN